MKRLLVACALASVAALLMVAASSAAPPGGTLTVSPSTPLLGASVVFTGCGWSTTNPNGTQNVVSLYIQQPDGTSAGFGVAVGKSGCFTSVAYDYVVTQPGAYSVYAFQKYRQAFLGFTVG